jgi:L-ascorbate metabolism protein UlaG (beta-lactamase superfamily)
VIGFLVEPDGPADGAIYVSGDTVWYDGVEAIARQHRVSLALLFLGAAQVAAAGPSHLTFTSAEAVAAARAFAGATIAPLHYEGWAHFAESRREVDAAFAAAGLARRLAWLPPGHPRAFDLSGTRATADAGMS